ncbi:hypothetical protein [Streptomyces cucumeris]|uniref:hypothetical protein n=1 Tax=Streptomyces cucumeris TaxID=2962890 RepID=UPI003D71DB3F
MTRNERGPELLIEMSDVSITLLRGLARHPAALDLWLRNRRATAFITESGQHLMITGPENVDEN